MTSAGINSLPADVVERIISFVHLLDIDAFVAASGWVKACFDASNYSTQMDFLVKNTVENDLIDVLRTMSQNRHAHWSTHDVLSCGQFAWHVIWLMVPPVKVCSKCITNPDYDIVDANRACGVYKVRRPYARANHLATIKLTSGWSSPIELNLKRGIFEVTLEGQVRKLAKQQGVDIERISRIAPRCQKKLDNLCNDRVQTQFGCLKVSMSHNGRVLRPMICGLCHASAPREWPYLNTIEIPMSYEHLRIHFAKDHPTLLDQFEKEWQTLPEAFRKEWTEYGEKPLIGHKNSNICIWKSWENELMESYHCGNLKNLGGGWPVNNLNNAVLHACCSYQNRSIEYCHIHHINYITKLMKELAMEVATENNLSSSKAPLTFWKNSANLTAQDEAIKNFEESSVRKVVSSITVFSGFEQMVVEFCERVRKQGIDYDTWPYHPRWDRLLAMPN